MVNTKPSSDNNPRMLCLSEARNYFIKRISTQNQIQKTNIIIDEKHVLGVGHFGTVYKGFLKSSKLECAVKCVTLPSKIADIRSVTNSFTDEAEKACRVGSHSCTYFLN